MNSKETIKVLQSTQNYRQTTTEGMKHKIKQQEKDQSILSRFLEMIYLQLVDHLDRRFVHVQRSSSEIRRNQSLSSVDRKRSGHSQVRVAKLSRTSIIDV